MYSIDVIVMDNPVWNDVVRHFKENATATMMARAMDGPSKKQVRVMKAVLSGYSKTGALRESIGQRSIGKRDKSLKAFSLAGVRTSKSYSVSGIPGDSVGKIGKRVGKRARGQARASGYSRYIPAFYAHLVDRGFKPHRITVKKKKTLANVLIKGKKGIFGPSVKNPGFRGYNFVRKTDAITKHLFIKEFEQNFDRLAVQRFSRRIAQLQSKQKVASKATI